MSARCRDHVHDRTKLGEQLKALQQEAETRLAPLLGGPRGVEAYKQYGGSWLTGMVPRTPPRPPAAGAAAPSR